MMDKVVTALISPLGTALLFAGLALLLGLGGRSRRALFLGACASAWLLAWSLPITSNAVSSYLENQHPPVAVESLPKAGAIVVLGGGVAATGLPSHPVDMGNASDRVWHSARLYHGDRAPLVLTSGGARSGIMPEAEAMALLLVDFGVPDNAILREPISRNTRQNASHSAQILARNSVDTILLVTSAAHMERSKRHFEREGLTVIPAATDYESRAAVYASPWLPSSAALDASARALKELAGQLIWR